MALKEVSNKLTEFSTETCSNSLRMSDSVSSAKIGGALYSDALSPADGPAATYIEMMRHNVRELVSALAQ